jgi:hypothetical protein
MSPRSHSKIRSALRPPFVTPGWFSTSHRPQCSGPISQHPLNCMGIRLKVFLPSIPPAMVRRPRACWLPAKGRFEAGTRNWGLALCLSNKWAIVLSYQRAVVRMRVPDHPKPSAADDAR